MRISVLLGDDLSKRRYTARVSEGGFLTFESYDELERETTKAQWRVKRCWHISVRANGGTRFDGVEIIDRPPLPENAKKALLESARKQIEWSKDQ